MASLTFDERVIAVVGVAKNCGKTTTLNALTRDARASGKAVGLVSSGVDGERRDVLLGTAKPPVRVEPGQLLASTRLALQESTATFEFVEDLRFDTPMGEAVIVRVTEPGDVVLAGMRHRKDVRAAVESLLNHGADQVWIDGAYGRVATAHPELADGIVVATGAIVGSDVDAVVEATAALVDRLTLPEIAAPWQRRLLESAVERDRVLLGGADIDPIELKAASALLALPESEDAWTDDVTAVAVPGLVSDRVLEELHRFERPDATLLLPDPTRLQADDRATSRFRRTWTLLVGRRCKLLAIGYNPTSIAGPGVDPQQLHEKLSDRYPKTSVLNPIVGLH